MPNGVSAPSRGGDVVELVVVDGDALGRALALDRDARTDAREDVLLDHERPHRRPQSDRGAGAVVHAIAR